jgi:hypothetical protein
MTFCIARWRKLCISQGFSIMLNASDFRIFISAVSSEFERVRHEIASDLRARGLTVKVQRDFRQESDTATTLQKLTALPRQKRAARYIDSARVATGEGRYRRDPNESVIALFE